MSGRSPEEREAARREREIRRLERAGEPVPPELREPVQAAPPPPRMTEPVAPPPAEPAAPVEPLVPAEPAAPFEPAEPLEPTQPPAHDTGEHHPFEETGEHHPFEETGEHDRYHPETGEHAVEPLAGPAMVPGFATAAGPSASVPKRQRKGLRRRWGIALLAVAGLFIVFLAWFAVQVFQPFDGGGGDGKRVAVKIPEGSSTSEVGDILEKAGVVDSAFFFELRARLDGTNLRSGSYTVAQGEPYGDVLKTLSTPPVAAKTVTVSIPEGLSRREIAPRAKNEGLRGNYVKDTVKSPLLDPRRYGAPKGTPSLEGFLFPATYELKPGSNVRKLVDMQLRTFKKQIATVDLKYAKKKNLTVYDILIIASMVDREAAVEGDRAKIAAVIYNRLKAKIPLGIDATTRYEYNDWEHPIKESQLQSDSGYNTRKNQGLPPTPIGNPGLASIKAAANPSRKGYLFFVVKPCGNGAHVFSSTNAQFLKDEAAYNQARAKNGGNDPSRCKG